MRGAGRRPLVALATSADWPDLGPDDRHIAPALARAGVDAEVVIWTEADVVWDRFDAIVIRSCWDYHDDLPRWLRWVDAIDGLGASHRSGSPGDPGSRLWNPAPVVRWNARKTYLSELATLGVPVVPTIWVEASGLTSWIALRTALGAAPWDDLVLKPAVSAGALGTFHLRRQALSSSEAALGPLLPELVRRGPVLVQRYLPEIATEGEWSLLFFDGRLSHAVVKRPAPGDFRVQEKHGGSTIAAIPSPEVVRVAERALVAAAASIGAPNAVVADSPAPFLYARVDLVVSGGTPLVIELELIEPALFLDVSDSVIEGDTRAPAADLLAEAIVARMRPGAP